MGLIRAVVICAVLGLTSGKDSGSSVYVFVVKAVGDNVLFNISRDPAPYTYLSWEQSRLPFPIITVIDGVNSTLPSYEDRITLLEDGSLELRNLEESRDSGVYTVNITSTEAPEFSRVFSLKVLRPVSNVTLSLSTNTTDLIELAPVTFTCLASGSDLLFSFYNQSQSLEEGTFMDYHWAVLDRYDTGPFRCEAYNAINRMSSEGVNFTFSYGPDVTLTTVPLQDEYTEGSNVTLTCSVDSKPEAEITWKHGEDLLSFNGTELVLEGLTYEQRGKYECWAYNRKADRRASKSKYIFVEYSVDDNSLSVAASLGIALACVAVAGGAAGGLAYLYHRKQKRASTH